MVDAGYSSKPIEVVSVGIVALNEEQALPALLNDVLEQDFPRNRIELLLIDGGSTDATVAIMERFADSYASGENAFFDVKVLNNPKRIQAAGWNVAINSFSGDVLIRVDAHSGISPNFVSANVAVLESGECMCGGYRPTVIEKGQETPWRQVLHLAEEAAFGSSVAAYRRDLEAAYVDSVFHGAYRREVIEAVGCFDERLLRTEDNDYHYRVRQHGYRIRFDPSIRSEQHVRASLKKMLKQKYGNGYWVGRTLFVQPGCLEIYHFAPFVFVMGIVLLSILGLLVSWIPFAACAALYIAACVLLGARAVIQTSDKCMQMLALPLIFFGIHASYGVGTLLGLISVLAKPFDKGKE